MSEPGFASLGPTLLARKGGAKPAMRPQLAPLVNDGAELAALADEQLEDLGWNDMGEDDAPAKTAEVVHLTPGKPVDDVEEVELDEPEVRKLREELAERVEQATKPAAPRKSALKRGKRAAFTLRLDADRHLKLRLASTMSGKSAQALVTSALDALLGEFDELDSLAEKMKRN